VCDPVYTLVYPVVTGRSSYCAVCFCMWYRLCASVSHSDGPFLLLCCGRVTNGPTSSAALGFGPLHSPIKTFRSALNNKSLALFVSVTFTISRAKGNATSSLQTGQCARTVHYVGDQEALVVAHTSTHCTIITTLGRFMPNAPLGGENGRSARS
jgi:hypothetical protein